MEATLSSNRTRAASRIAFIGSLLHAEPSRVLGVADGLVSVTQRAWGLIPLARNRIRVMQ